MSSETSDYGLTETTENYLKKIYTLSIQNEFARVSDIAKHMDRSLSTVTGAVQRMAQEGLLNYEKYGKITLTKRGEEIAKNIHYSYSTMKELLVILGIPEEVAIIDACSMEHQISELTIVTIKNFIRFTKENQECKSTIDEYLKNLKVEG